MVSRMSSRNFLPKYLGNPSVSGRFRLICVFCQVLAMCRPQQTAALFSSSKVEIFSLILHKLHERKGYVVDLIRESLIIIWYKSCSRKDHNTTMLHQLHSESNKSSSQTFESLSKFRFSI